MNRIFSALAAGFLIGLLGLLITLSPVGSGLEEKFGLSLLFKLRGLRQPPGEVVIVTLDKTTANHLGLPANPDRWPRSLHAQLVNNLNEYGASILVFDMIFNGARSPKNNSLFAESLQKAQNVILCEYLSREKLFLTDDSGKPTGEIDIEKVNPPVQQLAEASVALAPFPLPKFPVRVSQYWLFKSGAGGTPTLPVVAFQVYAWEVYEQFITQLFRTNTDLMKDLTRDRKVINQHKEIDRIVRRLKYIFENEPGLSEQLFDMIDKSFKRVEDNKKQQLLTSLINMYQGDKSRYLNFYGPASTITTYSYRQFLEDPANTNTRIDLQGKAVFIGAAGQAWTEQQNGFHTVYSQKSGHNISSVEIAATAFANLLDNMPVQALDYKYHLIFVFIWGALLGVFCYFNSATTMTICLLTMSILYLFVARLQFAATGAWYPIVVPVFIQIPTAYFSIIFCKYFKVKKEEKNIRNAFGCYLPDTVVDKLAKDVASLTSDHHTVYGTCLMTDAAFYTTLAETMKPEELARFMNTYFEALFGPVRKYGGVISDVVGDSMLAIWTTAKPDNVLRKRACHAALDIAKFEQHIETSTGQKKLPTRIGLHSGYMVLGNIGSKDHYEYTPIGDIVNTTSRIEGLNKYLNTRLLVAKDVIHELDGLLTRRLGQFLLAGKTKPVEIYELLSRMDEAEEQMIQLCKSFETALNAFENRSWDIAIQKFQNIFGIQANDGPSLFYLTLCEKYKKDEPGTDWDKVVHLTQK
jgi:adenylate cyclase